MVAIESTLHINRNWQGRDDRPDLETLIATLDNRDGQARQHARITLVKMGQRAVDALIKTLNNRVGPARWEAAKALSQIGSPKAAQALVKALEDDEFSVRWLAAEGLIATGHDGLKPLLEALQEAPESIRLREGAHHVLHNLVNRGAVDQALLTHLRPVLAALNDIEPAVAVPPTLVPALKMLK